MNPDQRLALIEQAALPTEPGTQWHSSNPGYLLIGQIVTRASGQLYADFITERILTPLELASATVGGVRTSAAIARGYRDGEPVPPWELSEMPGTGGICSTTGDVARSVPGFPSTRQASSSWTTMRPCKWRTFSGNCCPLPGSLGSFPERGHALIGTTERRPGKDRPNQEQGGLQP
jgi:CubicO group peptidase (beta-lactamase class C family)